MIDIKELRKVTAGCYWPTSSVTIDELLDRIEAAEQERDWHTERCEDAMNECDALRAKITEMEKQEPGGWLRVIDEALVTAHIGVANAHDTYEQAKDKLDNLIGFNVDIATDPAVNGGYKLVPVEPKPEEKL